MHRVGTWILHIKSEISYPRRHDMLPILKYLCIIGQKLFILGSLLIKVGVGLNGAFSEADLIFLSWGEGVT